MWIRCCTRPAPWTSSTTALPSRPAGGAVSLSAVLQDDFDWFLTGSDPGFPSDPLRPEMSCLLEALQDKRVRLQPECKKRLQDRIDMWGYAAKACSGPGLWGAVHAMLTVTVAQWFPFNGAHKLSSIGIHDTFRWLFCLHVCFHIFPL